MSARSNTPGLAWRKRGDKIVAIWICRPDISKAGYQIKTQRLWTGTEKPSPEHMPQIEMRCQRLHGEMMDWYRYWHQRPRGKGRMATDFIGSVYFIRCGELIKIGYARDVPRRLAHLQVASPFPMDVLTTVPGTKIDEAIYHRRFEQYRVRGEWFDPAPELMAFIDTTKKPRSPSVPAVSNDLERP